MQGTEQSNCTRFSQTPRKPTSTQKQVVYRTRRFHGVTSRESKLSACVRFHLPAKIERLLAQPSMDSLRICIERRRVPRRALPFCACTDVHRVPPNSVLLRLCSRVEVCLSRTHSATYATSVPRVDPKDVRHRCPAAHHRQGRLTREEAVVACAKSQQRQIADKTAIREAIFGV